MNIVFYLGSVSNGGAERVVANLTEQLIKKNNIMIITTVKKNSVYKFNKKIKIVSLDKTEINTKNVIEKNIYRINNLIDYIESFSADILISFLSEPCFRSLMIKNKIKIPIIISQRNDPKIEYKTFLYKILMKFLYPKADGIVFQTEEAKKYFSKKIQDKSTIIFNPVNEVFISSNYVYHQTKKIISIGRLDKQKNYPLLLNAFRLFIEDWDYKLHIYGEGPERKNIEKIIKENKLHENVILHGRVNDILDEMMDAEFYVLSSDFEGMPNSLIEAMCMGIPVISTDCPSGGPSALIKDNMGQLVKTNDTVALYKAMVYYAKNPNVALKFGKNAKKVNKLVNPELITLKWEEYIYSILQKK